LAAHPAKNPFIDPAGYRAYVERAESACRTALVRQRTANHPAKAKGM
jgi:hypothetical protein